MSAWLNIIGIGENGEESLCTHSLKLIKEARVIVGAERHFKIIESALPQDFKRIVWQTPISKTINEIAAHKGMSVVVLSTGDPMHFGIGVTLSEHFSGAEMSVTPYLSAFSMVCSRLLWPSNKVDLISLHGRPLEILRSKLADNARIISLTQNGETPIKVAKELTNLGYGKSIIHVFENLGGSKEKKITCKAQNWKETHLEKLNTIAIECKSEDRAKRFAGGLGLPDKAFRNSSLLTKREIRVLTLSALKPMLTGLLWDIGAGSGSISIEWLLANSNNEAIALEKNKDVCVLIAENANNLGVPRLKIEHGLAPNSFISLPDPDAIFVGGGISIPGVLDECWQRLKPGGRLVANAVTIKSEYTLQKFYENYGGKLNRISISRATPIGSHVAWKPLNPITQLEVDKS